MQIGVGKLIYNKDYIHLPFLFLVATKLAEGATWDSVYGFPGATGLFS